MRNSTTTLISIALLSLLAQPALSQEQPRVLFCMGQCVGIDKAGQRVPLNKGTVLAPGLRLETGPNSYMQVKLGNDAAFGMGERAQVRLEAIGIDRAALALDQGRVRVLDGEAIGKASARLVELKTSDGNLVLRGADIEVKAPPAGNAAPAPTLVKLNLGDARLGGLPVTKDVVHGIVDGKISRDMPMTDIVLRPRVDSPVSEPSRLAVTTLPVTGLTTTTLNLSTTVYPTLSTRTLTLGFAMSAPSHTRRPPSTGFDAYSVFHAVSRVHRDGGVTEQGLRAGGGDHQVAQAFGRPGAVRQRVAQVPEVALLVMVFHFQVGNGGMELGVPVDQAFAAVDQAVFEQADEGFLDRLGQARIHGEALARPVHRGAQATNLAGDGAAGFFFPLPDFL